jgi:Zn-dependent protease with chaperone function
MTTAARGRTFDFFSQQESNRKKTGLLVVLFVTAVILIIAALYGAITAILLMNHVASDPFDPMVLLGVAGATIALVIGGSLFKTSQLKQGGGAVARMLGGRLVTADTRDLKEKQLFNVVEEMAIASGTPMPEVYIIEEKGINAFAAGWGINDAAVSVTRGSLEYLSRDELQGVIAHEFSHVANGDMRLNIKLIGIIFGILLISQIGALVLRGGGRIRSGRGKDNGGAAAIYLIALALFLIGAIGVFFGNIIMAAVSRAREYLADASSVQFTRNPAGISGALKKIGGLAAGSRMLHPAAGQASHLFFADGRSSLWSNLFATHPPLAKRISAIDPRFDGVFPEVQRIAEPSTAASAQPKTLDERYMPDPQARTVPPMPSQAPAFHAQASQPAGSQSSAVSPVGFNAAVMLASVGTAQPEHIVHATGLIQSIPQALKDAIRNPVGAQAAIFALLLSKESEIGKNQLRSIDACAPEVGPVLSRLKASAASLERTQFMTVASLAVSGLKSMSRESCSRFTSCLKQLIEADGKISLFEYMLHYMVKRALDPKITGIAKPQGSIASLRPAARECAVVCSTLVWEGCTSEAEAKTVFAKLYSICPDPAIELIPRENCSLLDLDKALSRLDLLTFPLKKQLLSVCISIVEALECPIPPLVGV